MFQAAGDLGLAQKAGHAVGVVEMARLHFLQGEAKLTLDDDTVEARPGTWVHMPTSQRHSIQAKTAVVMLLLLMKSPLPHEA